jgi:catechol 2,3-dioxygenase-like lactoylglutathione lyase family enzyme
VDAVEVRFGKVKIKALVAGRFKLTSLANIVKASDSPKRIDGRFDRAWRRRYRNTTASISKETPMARTGLSHIALKSRDLKKTEQFYVDVLGCQVAFRHPPDMIFLTTPGSGDLLNFVKSAARISGSQGLEHIGFKVTAAELKKMEKTLKQHGVKIEGRRGREAFYFTDPNGYHIEYYSD